MEPNEDQSKYRENPQSIEVSYVDKNSIESSLQ